MNSKIMYKADLTKASISDFQKKSSEKNNRDTIEISESLKDKTERLNERKSAMLQNLLNRYQTKQKSATLFIFRFRLCFQIINKVLLDV